MQQNVQQITFVPIEPNYNENCLQNSKGVHRRFQTIWVGEVRRQRIAHGHHGRRQQNPNQCDTVVTIPTSWDDGFVGSNRTQITRQIQQSLDNVQPNCVAHVVMWLATVCYVYRGFDSNRSFMGDERLRIVMLNDTVW